jgi:hypothetical protein
MGFSVRLRSFLHMFLKYGQRIRRSNSLFIVCIQYCKQIEENRRGRDQRQLSDPQLPGLFSRYLSCKKMHGEFVPLCCKKEDDTTAEYMQSASHCQAFSPIARIGSPLPLNRAPPLWFQGGTQSYLFLSHVLRWTPQNKIWR